jgi:uncharacterized protein
MILPDVNVLLHTANGDAPQHAVARTALLAAFGAGPVAITWPALLGFLRLSTRVGILAQPLALTQALSLVQQWLDHPNATLVQPTAQHAAVLGRLLIGAGQGGPLVSDAHLAALAIEHGATMLSFDRDFGRFAGLRFDALPTRACCRFFFDFDLEHHETQLRLRVFCCCFGHRPVPHHPRSRR